MRVAVLHYSSSYSALAPDEGGSLSGSDLRPVFAPEDEVTAPDVKTQCSDLDLMIGQSTNGSAAIKFRPERS